MAVKPETVQGWIKVIIPVAYLLLMIQATYADGMPAEVKYYYYMHRFFHRLTRWSRKKEAEYMNTYYEVINP